MKSRKHLPARIAYAIGAHAVMIIVAFFSLLPIYIMVMGSFKDTPELLQNSVGLPKDFKFDNYVQLLSYNSGTILRCYGNAIFISVVYTAVALALASMAGYAFAKFSFKGKHGLFLMFLLTMMVPMELLVTPLYLIYSKIGLLNTYRVQIITGIANVFAMFMFRKNMETIPDSLIESACLDGASELRIYTSIICPVSKPVFGALTILVFLSKWNEYLLPKILVSKTEVLPIMVVLPSLSVGDNMYELPWELTLTGCTLVIIPLIIVFLIFQNQFLASVTIGAVKG